MELLDNLKHLLGDDLKQRLKPGARLKIAASCISMFVYEALKAGLEKIDGWGFKQLSPSTEVTCL